MLRRFVPGDEMEKTESLMFARSMKAICASGVHFNV